MAKTKLDLSQRIVSLDVFRGIIIVLMIVVNSQGTRTPYSLLAHVDWNGCSFADLVFPSFLFIVGLTMVTSLKKQIHATDKSSIYWSIAERSIILFLIGLVLNSYPLFDLGTLRFYGILQRIAICYFICAVLFLNTSFRIQFLIFLSILIGYWWLLTQVPVPGFGANQLTKEGSWVSYVDQLVFSSKHLFGKVFDPEGLLSTIPAVATTLAGVLTGWLLLSNLDKATRFYALVGLGFLSLVLAWCWSYSFPLNKNLWTSSFVLWTSGFALLGLSFCYLLIDLWGFTAWALPFKIFGMNALFAFVLHVLLLKTQSLFSAPLRSGVPDNLRIAIADHLYGGLGSQNAALLYSLSFLFLNFLVVAYLYKRQIFIRI